MAAGCTLPNGLGGLASPALFDSHCHLDLPELWPDWQRHWQEAQAVGIKRCLIPAVQQSAWPSLLQLTQAFPQFHVALGIHPWWVKEHPMSSLVLLETLLLKHAPNISAVGEIGLDYALDPLTFELQQQFFSAQLNLAQEFSKPVVLHHRNSMVHLLVELKKQKFQHGGILHAFSGSPEQGQAFIELGFKLGIGGTITYPRAEKTRRAVSRLPLTSLVLETDAPAMPLAGFQGQINTPKQLLQVFKALCALRSETPERIAEQLWQNTLSVLCR